MRMATSLLGLGLLLHGSSASAQSYAGTPGSTIPVNYPVIMPPPPPLGALPARPGQPPTLQAPQSSPAIMPEAVVAIPPQQEERKGPRMPYDTGVEFKGAFEVPGIERLTRLESEEDLFRRMEQEALKSGDRIVFPEDKALAREPYPGRHWAPKTMFAEPAYVAHGRLLFEQQNFERGLWDLGILTPPLSAAEFAWDVVTLPYHIATRPCQQYDTSAGKCLPGDASPFRIYPIEWSLSGAVAEAAAVTGVFFIFP
jgi:hypothetical protein